MVVVPRALPNHHSGDDMSANRTETQESDSPVRRLSDSLPGEQATIWTLWLVYGAFYFCRTNLSLAVPGMKSSIADGGLGLSGDEVGSILAIAKMTYGVGQLLNGQFAEHVSPRKLLAVGMFGSALLNLLFGFSTGF